MLSILIPTYNYNITKLVKGLHQQATMLEIDFEILVMEDGSTKHLIKNQTVQSLEHCQYIVLDHNVGRSAIRNRLAEQAIYPYLLFIDCDAAIHHKDFLRRYIACCFGEVVLIGGTAYDANMKDPTYSLRLKYGRERESNLSYLLHHHRNENFATFNFLISKSIFDKIKFNEEINGYGHEDTLFGYHLHVAGYVFQRIDNQLIHKGLDDNPTFLMKTRESVLNLYRLYRTGHYPFLEKESKLLHYFIVLQRYRLTGLVAFKFRLLSPLLERNLLGKHPSLKIYDVYKLMLLCKYRVNADKLTA